MVENNTPDEQFEGLLARYNAVKAGEPMDLSADQDLTVAIMNLLGIEEHLFFTSVKTEKMEYLELLNEVRNLRKELLKEIIVEYEGEVWCVSKHLLSASYRLMEVGTKRLASGDKTGSYNMFTKSYQLYSLFWGLAMNLFSDKIASGCATAGVDAMSSKRSLTQRISERLGGLVKRVVNCCIE